MKSHSDVGLGEMFGYLAVIGPAVKGDVGYYLPCMCACDRPCFVLWSHLSAGSKTSCGCHHGNRTHGFRRTRLYSIWSNMKQRCYNANNGSFHRYGGRGIRVTEDWRVDFLSFKDWAEKSGYQDDLTLERVDVNGNYEPGNCTWIPLSAQAVNRTSTRWVEYEDERMSLKDWSRDPRCVVQYHTLYARIRKGWPVYKALTTPSTGRG